MNEKQYDSIVSLLTEARYQIGDWSDKLDDPELQGLFEVLSDAMDDYLERLEQIYRRKTPSNPL